MKQSLFRLLAFFLALAVGVPPPAWALRQSQKESTAGLEEIKNALGGLEELAPEDLIDGWETFSADEQSLLAEELAGEDQQMLARLLENARDPVVPPRTLYELVAATLNESETEVQQRVESLLPAAWQPPQTVQIGESQVLTEPSDDEIRELLESTVIMVAAGGGGARFKKSLPPAFRNQLERRSRLEKPTVMIGPAGLSPTVRTLLEVAELARRTGARGVHVVVVDAPDSSEAVHHDVAEGTQGVDPAAVRISLAEQSTLLSFDPQTHKVLVTRDEEVGSPRLLRNPDGTYGTFLAAYRKAEELGVADRKDWLVLYGDDPRLNNAAFITRALQQRRANGLDAAAVTTPKLTPTVPVGGTRVDLVLGDQRLPLIVEKAERTPDPAKNIKGLPVLNQVEEEETAKGKDPFGFNTGVLMLSAAGARLVAEATPLIRYADRDRDDVPGGKRRNLEQFLTHGLTIVGAAGMRVGDLQVDSRQYQAAKDWGKVAAGSAEMDLRSRELLRALPGGSEDRVSVSGGSRLDLLPGFSGFKVEGEGSLDLAGEAGYILSPEGLFRVPVTEFIDVSWNEPDPADPSQEITRAVRHPVFADPEDAQLLLPANPDGTITLDQPQVFNAGLEERTTRRSFLRQLGFGAAAITAADIFFGPVFVGSLPGQQASAAQAIPVIPGLKLKGFGLETPAGRGGEIVRVTSLEDSGPGSLREAVEKKGPRVIVFETSGTISLKKPLSIREPFLTIAGQTAPAGGITLRGAGLTIQTHDVLVQHLRIRVGDDDIGLRGDLRDAVQIYGPADPRAPEGVTGARDVVFDACSFSWGIDELVGLQFAPENITFYRCIFSEALRHAGHPKDDKGDRGGHSKGLLIAESCKNILVAGCLFVHNYDRNPAFIKKGAQNIVFLNNVAYNSGRSRFVDIGSTDQAGWWKPETYTAAITASVKNNLFIAGPDAQRLAVGVGVVGEKLDPETRVYVSGNKTVGLQGGEYVTDASFNPRITREPDWSSALPAMPAEQVAAWVLARAGARPADRDAVDARIVEEVKTGKGGIIDSPKDRGGWPEIPVKAAPFAAPENPNAPAGSQGYTEVERTLYQMAQPLAEAPAGLEEGTAGVPEETLASWVEGLRRSERPPAGWVLVSPEALSGSEGVPALAPLLIAFRENRPAEEWAEIRGRVIAHTEDGVLAEQLEAAGYRTARLISGVNALLDPPPAAVTLYATPEEWLLREQVRAVTETVQLTPENFLKQLSDLLQLLGYVPPAPEALQPAADALLQAA